MTTDKRTFWIYKIKTALGERWTYANESILFPGRRNQVCSNWASKHGALAALKRGYQPHAIGAVIYEDCPLPHATAEEKAEYRNKGR